MNNNLIKKHIIQYITKDIFSDALGRWLKEVKPAEIKQILEENNENHLCPACNEKSKKFICNKCKTIFRSANTKMYIKSKEFNILFADVDKNWEGICLNIQKIVDKLLENKKYISTEEKEDTKSAILVHTLSKIKCFDKTKSSNPFSYFTSIINNQFKMLFTRQAQKKRMNINYIKTKCTLDELFIFRNIEVPNKIVKKPKVKDEHDDKYGSCF